MEGALGAGVGKISYAVCCELHAVICRSRRMSTHSTSVHTVMEA